MIRLLVRVCFGLALIVIGTFFDAGYKNPLYFYWLAVIIFLLLGSEFLFNLNGKLKQDLKDKKDQISTLTILKNNNNKALQISLYPPDKIIVNKVINLNLYATSALSLDKVPKVKVLTKTEWEIIISTQLQRGIEYADNYEFILTNPVVDYRHNRYIHYSFDIKIKEPGLHDFIIQVSNGEVDGELIGTLIVNRA